MFQEHRLGGTGSTFSFFEKLHGLAGLLGSLSPSYLTKALAVSFYDLLVGCF